MINPVATQLMSLRKEIREALEHHHRQPCSVTMLAVTKTIPCSIIQQAIDAGQYLFGENYVQEALSKINAITHPELEWHFIGPTQSNKTKEIASHFSWVHSVCRTKIAERLNDQRPEHLPPLNVCIQVNIDNEPQKVGVLIDEVTPLATCISRLPRLKLRGLMTIPATRTDFQQQRKPYHALRNVFEHLQGQGFQIDTLSMGMSNDWEAAIAEDATIIRVGTAIFGKRIN
jgi:pyridoxal phosphate enzyme (YggS family)